MCNDVYGSPQCRDKKSLWEALVETVTQVKDGRHLNSVGAVGQVISSQALRKFCKEPTRFPNGILIIK